MHASAAINVQGLTHRYGDHRALNGIDFSVRTAEIFGFLGPNGGGKTTLFGILATLLPVQAGTVTVLGHDAQTKPDAVRRRIGVTFQSASLDAKLTVRENLKHQAHLYGLSGRVMRERVALLTGRLGLSGRENDRAESLSGGLKRRVEIAKGLLHSPELLLLDEPSTGLDPAARHDLWRHLHQVRDEANVTVVVTTHLMDEAERCDRLGILDEGQMVGLGTPDELRGSVGGDCLTVRGVNIEKLADQIVERFGIEPRRLGDSLRIEQQQGHELLRDLMDAFPDDISSVSLGKPTLEDVFIDRTGHRFWDESTSDASQNSAEREVAHERNG